MRLEELIEAKLKVGDVVTHKGKKHKLVKRNDRNNQERWETDRGAFIYASDVD